MEEGGDGHTFQLWHSTVWQLSGRPCRMVRVGSVGEWCWCEHAGEVCWCGVRVVECVLVRH